MAEVTQDQAAGSRAELNGQAPAGEPCAGCVSKTDRVMGLVAAGVAVVLLVIGADLATGGALSRWAGLGGQQDQDQDQAQES